MKPFNSFLNELTLKVSAVKTDSELNSPEIRDILLKGQELFPKEFEDALFDSGISDFIKKVGSELEKMEPEILHYLVIREIGLVDINFAGRDIVGKAVELKKVVKDLGIMKHSGFFSLALSFLAQDDFYDYIQLYFAIKKK